MKVLFSILARFDIKWWLCPVFIIGYFGEKSNIKLTFIICFRKLYFNKFYEKGGKEEWKIRQKKNI